MEALLESLWQDVRFAVRSLNKDRRFTLLAVLALSLGIGSVTVIFSAVYGVLIDTFPYAHFDRMVSFSIDEPGQPGGREMLTIPEFLDFRGQNHVFVDMNAGTGDGPFLYRHNGQTTEWTVTRDSANGYEFLGVKPLLGRLITLDDAKPGAPPVFMMTYKLWKEQFDGDPTIVGKTFDLDDRLWTLVGVMPPRFRAGWSDIFTAFPLDRAAVAQDPSLAHAMVWPLGYLKPGVTVRQAAADLNTVAHNLAKVYPDRYPKEFRVTARSFRDRVVIMFEPILYPLLAAVLLLMLISCTNVANLLLSRATVRDREIAVRAALGAGRWRLIRQLLAESFLLAGVGCFAGCFFAYLGIRELVPLIPYDNFPQESVIQLNWTVLAAAMALAILATVLCGLAPAIHAIGGSLQPRLTGAGKGSGGHGHGGLRSALVVAEVGLSIVLLIGAGLMMRTYFSMAHRSLGYNPMRILSLRVDLPPGFYVKEGERQTFFDNALSKLQTMPGMLAVAEAATPFGSFEIPSTVPSSAQPGTENVGVNMVSEDFFRIFGAQLLRGRPMSLEDVKERRTIVIVNESFARKFFPQGDALGHKIDYPDFDQMQAQAAKAAGKPADANMTPSKTYFDIVGIVADIKGLGPQNDQPQPITYIPSTTVPAGLGGMLILTTADADRALRDVQQAIWSLEPQARFDSDAGSLRKALQKYIYAQPQFEFVMLSTFAAIGLLLVGIGVYSVMAYNVSLQTREIGIRMALGAQKIDIMRTVLRRGAALIFAGVLVGLFSSWGLTRLMSNLLSGVKPTDRWTFASVVVVILGIGLAACFFPAHRATKVDPLDALRYE
jgi:putative ABC transport system permease protein